MSSRWSSSHRSVPSLPAMGGGKEELRAAMLKPYLLRLRDERGQGAVKALLSSVGVPLSVLEDEGRWISASAAKRALQSLSTALGEEQMADWGEWLTHPEVLGSYVRMLRIATTPVDAYRYLTANAHESTRIGHYDLESSRRGRVVITYTPRDDAEAEQSDKHLCLARQGELASLVRIWGLDSAVVEHDHCLAREHDQCRYVVRWKQARHRRVAAGAALGALMTGGPVAIAASPTVAGLTAVTGAGLGAAVGALLDRISEEHSARAFEKNRIVALERGLEVRGQFREASGDLTGTTLGGKYRILRRIGSGGIGAVYAAEHVALGSRVAIKILRGHAAADASEIARLRREAQVQVSIEHPNVVRTFDLDQMPDGSIFVVMELLEGSSLADRLRERAVIAPGFCVPVFVQVCHALSAAHEIGIVHRDLKPGNIFICKSGGVKVLDFGMSKFAEAETLTQTGYTLGTPEYMSPEQCIGAPVEPRTDLYSFGVLMYEALTGEIPIQGRNRRDLLELHQRSVPKSMRLLRPDLPIPTELDQAVMACLAKRAAERPATARELRRMLEAIPLENVPSSYPEPSDLKAAST